MRKALLLALCALLLCAVWSNALTPRTTCTPRRPCGPTAWGSPPPSLRTPPFCRPSTASITNETVEI
mgnify:CR=1 FL=1